MTYLKQLMAKPTGDLLVVMIASTVCFVVLATLAVIAILEIINPETDTTSIVNQLSDVINTLIGLMAGFLAGRTDANATYQQKQKDREQV